MKKTKSKIPWTRFMDMHSGGSLKEKTQYIHIQAPEKEAVVIFYNRFGHSTYRVTCTCCGPDYSIGESPTLEESSAYDRSCRYDKELKKWVEEPDEQRISWQPYQTVQEYGKREDVMIIHHDQIKPEERTGDVPVQGYVWQD